MNTKFYVLGVVIIALSLTLFWVSNQNDSPTGAVTGEEFVSSASISPTSCAQLKTLIEADCSADYELQNDVDCTGETGLSSMCSGGYSGTFDGGNHTITGLTIQEPSSDEIGLFSVSDGTIKNLGLIDVNITGARNVGGFIGDGSSATLNWTHSTGVVNGTRAVGGLIGYVPYANIDNSYSTATITAFRSSGGLVGEGWYFNIDNSYSTGNVSGDNAYLGGLVGYAFVGRIDNSYATGNVTGVGYLGGLIGRGHGSTIDNSYATGNIRGRGYGYIGGLVGQAYYSGYTTTINNSYSTGDVSGIGYYVGGILGYTREAIVDNSYSTGTINSTIDDVGGLVGYGRDCSISNSHSTGNIYGADSVSGILGVGRDATIINSYSTGNATGEYNVGGILGYSSSTSINNSYATGSMLATLEYVGGLVGGIYGPSFYISNSYATGNVEGVNYVGGLVGESDARIDNSFATGEVTLSGSYAGGLTGQNTGSIGNCYWYDHDGDDATDCYDGGNDNCTKIDSSTGIEYFYDVADTSPPYDVWDFTTVWDIICDDLNYPPLQLQNASESYCSVGEDTNDTNITGGGSGCSKDWECGSWGVCINGIQSRTCNCDCANDNDCDGDSTTTRSCDCSSGADCDDGNQCTQDVCLNFKCEYNGLSGVECDDGDNCTDDDKCRSGVCVGVPNSDCYSDEDIGKDKDKDNKADNKKQCNLKWECRDWTDCANGIQSRTCICDCEDNNCTGDPQTTRDCQDDAVVVTDININSVGEGRQGLSGQEDQNNLLGSSSPLDNPSNWALIVILLTVVLLLFFGWKKKMRKASLITAHHIHLMKHNKAYPIGVLIILVSLALLFIGVQNDSPTGAVTGEEFVSSASISPTSCAQLKTLIEADCTADYVLGGNLDCTGEIGLTPICNGLGGFSGTLDGNGSNITGLKLNFPATDHIGLFGYGYNAKIDNLCLHAANITGSIFVGGFIGNADKTLINNSCLKGNVTGANYVGGLVGWMYSYSQIDNSYVVANVSATGNEVGGLVGYAGFYGGVDNSYSEGSVIGSYEVGGVAGQLSQYLSVENSYSSSSVSGVGSIGGLIGYANTYANVVDNSYATGDVTGTNEVGGIIGRTYYANADNSFATGTITGATYVGGLIGYHGGSGNLDNGYWLNNSDDADSCVGGEVATVTLCLNKSPESYFYDISNAPLSAWDFVNTWCDANDGLGYPFFLWDGPCIVPSDTTPPSLDWNATDINSTITVNYTTICVNASETVNCTLWINGTDYVNTTSATNICWMPELGNGNYTLNATCDDTSGNNANTSNAWLSVDTSISFILTKTANTTNVQTNGTINWTITVNNTGLSSVNVTLNDSNGQNFSVSDLAAGDNYTISYTTNASCDNINNTVNATVLNHYTSSTDNASFLVNVTHCGDGVCNCLETTSSCAADCPASKSVSSCNKDWECASWGLCANGKQTRACTCGCDHDKDCSGNHDEVRSCTSDSIETGSEEGIGSSGPNGSSGTQTPPKTPAGGKPDMQLEGEPKLDSEIDVLVKDSTGKSAEGTIEVTAPDGTKSKHSLSNGRVPINLGLSGTWEFTYTDSEGQVVTKTVSVAGVPQEPKEIKPTVVEPKPAQIVKKQPQQDMTWLLASFVLIILALFGLFLWKKKQA